MWEKFKEALWIPLDSMVFLTFLSMLAGATNMSGPPAEGIIIGLSVSVVIFWLPFLVKLIRFKIKNKDMKNKWIPKPGEEYYYIEFDVHGIAIKRSVNWGSLVNITHVTECNCFKTEALAIKAKDAILNILRSN